MQLIRRYGESSVERQAEEAEIAREIVREITSHIRVSQRQLLLIIHGLAMNLELTDEMVQITSLVRSLRDDLFIIDRVDADKPNSRTEGAFDGKIIV